MIFQLHIFINVRRLFQSTLPALTFYQTRTLVRTESILTQLILMPHLEDLRKKDNK